MSRAGIEFATESTSTNYRDYLANKSPILHFREPVELSFPSMQVAVKLPKIIDGTRVCVRAARSMIDLLSESSRSFALAADMPNRYEGTGKLLNYNKPNVY